MRNKIATIVEMVIDVVGMVITAWWILFLVGASFVVLIMPFVILVKWIWS